MVLKFQACLLACGRVSCHNAGDEVSALEILAQNKVEKERWQAEIAAAACELKRAQSNLQEVEKEVSKVRRLQLRHT
eukprot:2075603-Amphidinium_carterae.1